MAPNKEPWHPYNESGNFKFTDITLEARLNAAQINGLLSLIAHVSQGQAKVTLKNEADLCKAWDNVAAELTPFSKLNVTTLYKKEMKTFDLHFQPLWDWALDLLANPILAPHFVWDAQHLFKHDGVDYKHFCTKPWTGEW
ncbi:hypothetical protein PAXRUDRAFT_15268 [Paxillus rubicundulus Ve08.2h10]|uniref:Uncharacterized protein n=1 Tax=Paxillus rubicundulus Ve08.2h10 TaxID=930991 RepID=A0A0D0CFA9_9AGAM|nr:hypothetical protein PAXRUDRAFT_15268 [Paxillus rubicundulus Ve08.2h10]